MSDDVTLLAVGDIALRPDHPHRQLAGVAPLLRGADLAFGQLELPLTNAGTPQLHPGFRGRGGAVHKDPAEGARLLAEAGFSVMSFAGNHTMDRSAPAMLTTLAAAEAAGVRLVGAGADLAAARRPAVLEVRGTRVGFLAYCSVLPRGYEATAARPGVAPLRVRTLYEQVDWQPGTRPRIVTHTHPGDLAALVADVRALRERADVVVVSMHWGIHFEPGGIADYQYEAGHAAVDAGADVVLGHHGHVVQAVEFHRGRPVFHSLGNMTLLPRGEGGRPLTEGGRPASQHTMIARLTISGGRVARVSVIPCRLDDRLEPEVVPAGDPGFGDFLRRLRWVGELPSTPRDPWEALYLAPSPDALALRDVRFTAEGDEIVAEAAGAGAGRV